MQLDIELDLDSKSIANSKNKSRIDEYQLSFNSIEDMSIVNDNANNFSIDSLDNESRGEESQNSLPFLVCRDDSSSDESYTSATTASSTSSMPEWAFWDEPLCLSDDDTVNSALSHDSFDAGNAQNNNFYECFISLIDDESKFNYLGPKVVKVPKRHETPATILVASTIGAIKSRRIL